MFLGKKRLFWKFFFSYFAVILLSMVVLGIVIRVLLPGVFDNHLVSMATLFSRHGIENGETMMGGRGHMMSRSLLFMDLFAIFNRIIFESILLAILPAIVTALAVSAIMSRQFVRPLQQMARIADRISDGNYQERLPVDTEFPEGQDELGQLADRFNRMTAQLEDIEDRRQKFIGNVAHELRTPLTVIKGSMEGLKDGVLPPEEATYERIYRQTERLERLVRELSELNRIQEGVTDFNLRPVDVNAELANLVEMMEITFSRKRISLMYNPPQTPLVVLADADRFEQIMINLLTNARQHTPPGGKVSINVRNKGEMVKILVRDTGYGIPLEHLDHVFDRFYRVDESRSREGGGSGIGLTIARYLVEAQGGRIWVESAGQGQGATFSFTLPKASPPNP